MKTFIVRLLCMVIPFGDKRRIIRNKLQHNTEKIEWIGRHSYVGYPCSRMHKDTKVGAFCSIGRNVGLGPAQHPINWLSTAPFQYEKPSVLVQNQTIFDYNFEPVTIGNDVWIGNNVIIKDGVTISDGCIIGSNAVVTHNTEPYGIYVGVPAKLIRYRFSQQIINDLLNLKWWDLPDEQIATLPFNDIKQCISILKIIRNKID